MESLDALKDVPVMNIVDREYPWYKEYSEDLKKRSTDAGVKYMVRYVENGNLLDTGFPTANEFILDAVK